MNKVYMAILVLSFLLYEVCSDTYKDASLQKQLICTQCQKFCPHSSNLCCANPPKNQWTCFDIRGSSPITCTKDNICPSSNKSENQKGRMILVNRWITSSGGQPTLRLDNNRKKSIVAWNSLGFAPAWIQLQFETQFVKTLNLVVSMLPNGPVVYKITVDDTFDTYSENLIAGTQKVYKINKFCSKINIMTFHSPSWVAWDDIYITG